MSWGRSFRRLLRLPSRSAHTIDRDVNDEVAFHLEMRTAELRARGLAAREAQTQAQREFGDIERARAALRAADGDTERVGRRSRWLAELSQDLSFGWRQLARRPGFAFVAVLTLGLGIGANTAIVSAVRGILLQPLPFDRPEQLYRIQSQFKDRRTAVSVPDFEDFQRDTRTFSSLTAYYESTANFTGAGDPQRWASTRVTSRFFSTLRVRPLLGRVYAEGEDREGGPLLAVLSEGLWRNAFGADPAVIGRTLQLDGQPAQVIGVVPAAGTYPEGTDLWLPSQFTANDRSAGNRGARWLRVIGRLADGATLERASADLGRTAARLATEDPKHNTGYGVSIIGLRESLVGDMRKPLYVLLGAVALLMLVSCANVAGLQLGRTMARDGELAVRTALGAGRGRMIRQLLAENVTLALLGAGAGYLIAIGGTHLFARLAPPDMPRLEMMRVDLTMLAFTVGVAVVTGVLFGLIPALNASHEGLHLRLREGSRGSGGRAARARARQTLVVGEIALALVLLVGAGLLLRSFARLRAVDPGFVAEGNTAFTVTLPESAYPGVAQQRQFGNELLAALRRVPGVSLAAASFGLPLTDTRFSLSFTVDGRPAPPPTDEPSAQVRVASTDYFRAMGVHLLRGRSFEDRDNVESPQVVVVSQELVRRYFPNQDPLGKVLRMGWRREGRELGGTIVGVVGDVKQFGLGVDAIPTMFVAMDQWPMDEMTFVVRSPMSAATLAPMLRSAVHTVDPRLPIFDYTALAAVVDASLAQPRFYLSLLLAFAGAALLLAAVGLYGVIAYAVQQRAREIGVRMALGASSAAVLRMVVREGLVMSAVGVLLGIAGALALTRLLQSLLFGVTPADPVTFAGVSILLTLVAVLASIVPARRAASVDPQLALRGD